MIRRQTILLITLLIVGCDRYEYIADDKRFDKWKGKVYIKMEKEPDDLTMPEYVAERIRELKVDRLSSGRTDLNNVQIYRDNKIFEDYRFKWKEADTIIYHWVKDK